MIRVLVCGYNCDKFIDRCLASIDMQSNKDYEVRKSIVDDSNRIFLVENTVNLINSSPCDPEDILVCLDADDFLIDEDAFKIISEEYAKNPNLLLTYGSYVNLSSNKRGKFCAPYDSEENVRKSEVWKGSHLKTFKYKLWQQLSMDQLKDIDCSWFKYCADRAMMIPMMELAGHDRIKYIHTLLYGYNDTNPLGVWKNDKVESLRVRSIIFRRNALERLKTI